MPRAQRPKCSIQRPASKVQRRESRSRVQSPGPSVQSPASRVQRPALVSTNSGMPNSNNFPLLMNSLIRHSSHVTKSRIFKNLDLRKKADRNFRRTFLKNRLRHLKLYSNLPSWLASSRCHMSTFWKPKDWSSHFWESQPFRCWYVEVHRQRKLKSTKAGISS